MKLSPSLLDYKSICPSYEPKTFDEISASDGKKIHKLLADDSIDRESHDDETLDLYDSVNITIESLRKTLKVDESDVLEEFNELKLIIFTKDELPGLEEDVVGYADKVIVNKSKNSLAIVDYKTGRRGAAIDAKDSYQLKAYGKGALSFLDIPIKKLYLVFISPRANDVDLYQIDIDDINNWKKSFIESIKNNILNKIGQRIAVNTEVCSKCMLSTTCEEAKKLTMSAINNTAVVKTDTQIDLSFLNKDITSMDNGELSQTLFIIDFISNQMEKWKKQIVERVVNEDMELVGFSKAVRTRELIPEEKTFDAIKTLLDAGIPLQSVADIVNISITKLKKILPNANDLLQPFIDKVTSAPYLMKRRALTYANLLQSIRNEKKGGT